MSAHTFLALMQLGSLGAIGIYLAGAGPVAVYLAAAFALVVFAGLVSLLRLIGRF